MTHRRTKHKDTQHNNKKGCTQHYDIRLHDTQYNNIMQHKRHPALWDHAECRLCFYCHVGCRVVTLTTKISLISHNHFQYNKTQHSGCHYCEPIYAEPHVFCCYTDCHYAECHFIIQTTKSWLKVQNYFQYNRTQNSSVITFSLVMLTVVFFVVMLIAIMLSVVSSFKLQNHDWKFKIIFSITELRIIVSLLFVLLCSLRYFLL